MQAGKLDRFITIEQKSVVKDTFGAEVVTWTPVINTWAEVRPISGREFLQAKQVQEEVTVQVRLRYTPGIKPAMRVTVQGHIYDIVYVQESNLAGVELVLMCRELVDG
jgi:SPP1 family predicted phage head-tail adaptor